MNDFLQKTIVWGKWAIEDPKSSGSGVRIVLQFCTMKKAKRDMEIILMVFLKKDLIQGIQSSFVISSPK